MQCGLQSHLYLRGLCGGCWKGASSSLEPRRSDTPCPAGPGTDEAHTPAPPLLQHKHTHAIYKYSGMPLLVQALKTLVTAVTIQIHNTQQRPLTHEQLDTRKNCYNDVRRQRAII